jgi:vacuolar-type H+-ATPase subunit E/Vma4
MSFLNRFKKAAPALVTNGTKRQFNQKQLNNASIQLKNALNKIANQHVLKYANDIRKNAKANANVARAAANAAANPTQTNVKNAVNAAKNAAVTNNKMKQSGQAAEAVVEAVNAATLNVNKLIGNINATNNLNTFLKNRSNNMNKVPANRKNNVNLALARKRAALLRGN